jgi:hypothetical protein
MRLSFAMFVLSFVLAGCNNLPARVGNSVSAAGTPQRVTGVAGESEKLDTTLSLPAQITPCEMVDIYPKVTGFLDTISVDRGSRVHAGELIIRLSTPELLMARLLDHDWGFCWPLPERRPATPEAARSGRSGGSGPATDYWANLVRAGNLANAAVCNICINSCLAVTRPESSASSRARSGFLTFVARLHIMLV